MFRTTLRFSGAAVLSFILAGCPANTDGQSEPAQAPVIVVQAPPETPSAAGQDGSEYPGLDWQAPSQAEVRPNPNDPTAEPYDIVALLREFDPQITDPPKDQVGETGYDDILSAFAVMDDKYLYGRVLTRAPMKGSEVRETRFWIEQGEAMVTVEVKVGSQDSPCELADVKKPEEQTVVPACFWLGNALDFRVPLDKVPSIIDLTKPYWVSGFQTCCSDEERNKPYDEVEGAQEVWKVPGLAAEVESR